MIKEPLILTIEETQMLWVISRQQMLLHLKNMQACLNRLIKRRVDRNELRIYMNEIRRTKYWIYKNQGFPTFEIEEFKTHKIK